MKMIFILLAMNADTKKLKKMAFPQEFADFSTLTQALNGTSFSKFRKQELNDELNSWLLQLKMTEVADDKAHSPNDTRIRHENEI